MPNNSATGGYLVPTGTAPLEDDALDDFLQAIVVGVTGLPATDVVPRWQPESQNLPAYGSDWASIGVKEVESDVFAVEIHDPQNNNSKLQRHEVMVIGCSFYGPNAGKYSHLFRDGMQIAQNREALKLAGMAHVETGEPLQVPLLIKEKWTKRYDISWRVRRGIFRTYPVLNLLSMVGTLHNEQADISIDVNQ